MNVENIVNEMYEELINNNVPMTISSISNYYNILIAYNDDINCHVVYRGFPIIYLKNDTSYNMWQEFTHELAHFAMHDTKQTEMHSMFNDMQENQANKFSILFQMPQSVIESEELFTQDKLINHFGIDYEKALKRLKLLFNYYCSDRGITNGDI